MTKDALPPPTSADLPEPEDGQVDPSQLPPPEAVQVLYETLAERERGEIQRILKSACALLEFECEFHDEQDPA